MTFWIGVITGALGVPALGGAGLFLYVYVAAWWESRKYWKKREEA
jgi:hypothetical protein